MATLAIVVSLVGKAWAENADGERRALEVGDRLGAEETLIMAEGARIDLDFGDSQQLTFLGEQQVTAQAREDLAEEADSLAPLEQRPEPETEAPRVADEGVSAQGHSFVQLVRIGEIIEADGITPVTVARIQEVLRPMGLSLPQAEFVRDEPRETWSSAGRHEANDSFPETGSKLPELSISIDVIAGDDIVDATEAQQTITLTGTVGGGVSAGDTVTATVNGQLYSTIVNADGKTWQVDVPGSELAQDSNVHATVESVEPNGTPVSAETQRPYEVDNATPDASVELKGAGPDGIYNESEIVDGKVPGEVTLGTNTEPGDTIVVTDGKGNELINRPVTQDDIDNGIIVDVPVEHDQSDVEVNVELTDPTGNTSSATDSKPVDAVTPKLTAELEGAGTDGVYSVDEITDGKVTGNVTLDSSTVEVGDRLVIEDASGTILIDRPVTQDDINDGVRVELSVAPGDTSVEFSATITDPAGNSSDDADNKAVDNVTPTLDVTLEPGSGPNGEYNDSDTNDGKVEGTIELDPNNTRPGDTIVVTDGNDNEVISREITQADIDNGITVELPVSDGQTNVELNATVTDPAGNSSDGKDNNLVDNVTPSVSVELEPGSGPNGDFNDTDIKDGKVTGKVTFDPKTTEPGDTVSITDKDGKVIIERPITQNDIDNGISVDVPVTDGQTNVELNAKVTDPAGNSSTGSDDNPVDGVVPGVNVELEPGSGPNGEYNDDDTNDGKVTGEITFGPETEVGDKITVTDKDGDPILDSNGDPITDYEVTQDDIDNGVTVDVPVSDGDIDVGLKVEASDSAGNTSTGSDRNDVDNTIPGATATLEPGNGPNGEYNDDDTSDGKVEGTVTFDPDTTEPGDTVKVTDKGGNVIIERSVTQDDIDNGIVVDVPVADGQTNVELNVDVTDPAGNTSSTGDSNPVDNVTPTVDVELEAGSGPNGTYNDSDASQGIVKGTITFDQANTQPGDKVTATDKDDNPAVDTNGNPVTDYELTQSDIDNGLTVEVPITGSDTELELNADVTDAAGNSSSATDSKPVDAVTPTLTAELEGAGGDDVYSVDEIIDGKVTGKVTLDADTVEEGDRLVIEDASGTVLIDRPVTQDDINDGVSVEVSVASGDTSVDIKATITDPSGNSSDDTDNKGVDNITPTVGVELEDGSGPNGSFNEDDTESGFVEGTITLDSSNTKPGDTVVVTDGNGDELINREVTQDDIDNGIAVDVPVSDGQTDVELKATVTDPAGNSSDGKDDNAVDNVGPGATVELEDGTGPGGSYNEGDITDGRVEGEIVLTPETEVGDTIVVTDGKGNELINRPVTKDDIDNGGKISVEVPVEPGQPDVVINVELTDPAGNESGPITDSKDVDNVTPTVEVELEAGSGTNGKYNDDDIKDGKVEGAITFDPNTTSPGDKITVTDKDSNPILDVNGEPITDYELTPDDIVNGIKVDMPVDPTDTEVELNVKVEDTAGNSSTGSDSNLADGVVVTAELTVSEADVFEGSNDLEYTVTLKDPNGDPAIAANEIIVTTELGSIVIAKGESSGTLEVPVQGDDVYKDPETVTNKITGITEDALGGDTIFENLIFDNAVVSTEVKDTVDTTTISLNSPTVVEGEDITLTATVDHAPETDLKITLSNDETITIAAGQTAGSVTFTNPNGEDVYQDGETLEYSITDTAGGNYEDLDSSATSTVTVVDSIDTTTVTLSDVTVNEGDGITITASVDHAPQDSGLILTLSNGQTITIPVGDTTGSVTFSNPNIDTPYMDGEVLEYSITGTTGGNYENLDISDKAVVTVNDTVDTTTVTLNNSTVSEGADITINASVDNAPQGSDLVLTLSNGEQITIAAGATNGSVTFANPNDEDVYRDGETLEYGITASSGGNYEDLDTTAKSTITVEDTADTVTAKLTVSEDTVSEGEAADLVYTVTLEDAAGNPVTTNNTITVNTTLGDIVIGAGNTHGAINVPVQADDAYNNEEPVVNEITGITEANAGQPGSFENLAADTTAVTTKVNQSTTPTTITLSDITGFEGESHTITATVDHAVTENDLVIALDNGQTITIAVGDTTGTSNPFEIQSEDVYLDAGSYDVAITGVTGGNFEQVIDTATSTVSVNDTIDSVYAIIEADVGAVLEGGSVKYSVKLVDENGDPVEVPAGNSIDVALKWEGTADASDVNSLPSSITLSGGQSESQFTVETNADSLPELSEQLTAIIEGVTDTDQQFEDLQIGHVKNNTTVTIFDKPSISASNITVYEKGLTDDSSEGDGSVTATGTLLVSAPTGLENITIDGKTITLGQLGATPHTISVEGGDLTITSFTPTAQSNGNDAQWEIEYSYTLNGTQPHTAQGIDNAGLDLALDVVATDPADSNLTITESGNDLVVTVVDDVPEIVSSGVDLDEAEVTEADLGATVTVDFSGAFDASFGADGAATSNSLIYELVVKDTDSGLTDTATEKTINLVLDGDVIKGVVDDSTDVAFTITLDPATGKVTLEQSRALEHNDPLTPNDFVKITNGAINIKATAKDGDGDEASAEVNIGDRFVFQDDGPALKNGKVDQDGFVIGNEIVDEKYLPSGSDSSPNSLTFTKDLPVGFGADGVAGTAGLKFANTDVLEAMGLKSGTKPLAYEINTDGNNIFAKADGKDIFTIILSVDGDGTPSYEFTLKGPLDHTLNADGETADNIVLPFEITATDGDGDSIDLKFKVEVKDDTPASGDRDLKVNEDGAVSFSNADINTSTVKIQAANQLADDPDGNAVWDLTGGHGQVLVSNDGTITYKPNEDYRGEDSYTYTVTTDGGTYDRTVNITVKPVADKPLFADENGNYPGDSTIDPDGSLNTGTYDYSVQTDEDVSVGLQLHVPKVKDGGSAATSDPAELLGAITLGFKDLAADYTPELQLADGTVLSPDASGEFQFVIVDNETDKNPLDLHLDIGLPAEGTSSGVHYLTETQYKGLQVRPPAERHENFKTEVSVDSYEVDEHGEKLAGVNGATSTQTIDVKVQAVTDPIELKIETDQDSHSYEMDEDTAFNLNDKLTVNYPDDYVNDHDDRVNNDGDGVAGGDIDGSETRWFEITGLPEGTKVNGVEVTPGEAFRIEAPNLSTSADGLPDINIAPPKDFSGDLKDIIVTLKAQDKDSDDGNADGLIEEDSITLDLQVNPVAGDVAIEGTEGLEDEPIAFLEKIKVTDESTASGTLGEVITEVSFTVPTGWSHDAGQNTWSNTGGQTWTMAPSTSAGWTGSWNGDEYTITFTDSTLTTSEREDILKEFTVTPPAHSSKDIDLEVEVTSVDHSISSAGSSSAPASQTGTLTVVVKPVAEDVDTNSDGADGNDVTMGSNHIYQTPGEEDDWFVLGTESGAGITDFQLSNGWSNEDGKWVNDGSGNWSEDTSNGRSEDTFALLTPYSTADNDARHDGDNPTNNLGRALEGSVFTYSDGTTTFTLPFAGEPVKIPMQYLDSVQFKGPADWAGVVKIKVEAHTVDYDEDDSDITAEATSGESWLTNLIIEPRADEVTLQVDTPVKTLEDEPVTLNILPTSSDDEETFDVTISKIPKGAKITYNSVEYDTLASTLPTELTDNGDGTYTLEIEGFDKTEQPELTPPKDSNEDIELTVKAESVDTLTYINDQGDKVVIQHKGNTKTTTVYDGDSDTVKTPAQDETVGSNTPKPLPIKVDVQGVPDEPNVTIDNAKEYWEDGVEDPLGQNVDLAPSLEVDLKDLVTDIESGEIENTDDGSGGMTDDGSETVTLRISDLPEGFTLTGAGPQLGAGSGTDRLWVISKEDLKNVKIGVPEHYSGTAKFTVQPVVTENDNPSHTFFDKKNVSFKVKPVAEASLSISSDLTEDTVGKLDLHADLKGDTDEFISQVRIKVSDVTDKNLTLSANSDGTGTPTTETIEGVDYYVFNTAGGSKEPEVYVKGPANHSGDIKLNIGYTVTDPVGDPSADIAEGTKTGTVDHTLRFEAVTDEIGAAIDDITDNNTGENFTYDDVTNTASIKGSGKVTVKVDVSQQTDANANYETDTDGSEQLTHIQIEGVPQGVTVEGAVNTGEGQWLIETTDSFNSDTLTKDIVFNVTGHAENATSPITITSYSKDNGPTEHQKAQVDWDLVVNQSGEGEGELPSVTLTDKATEQTEDNEFALSDQIETKLTGGDLDEYDITVTLRTSPGDDTEYKDASGNLLTRTEVTENGDPVVLWTKTESVGQGDDAKAKLDALLESIKVHTPEHANTNNLPGNGNLPLDVTVSVHANGVSKKGELKPEVELTPVTDETTVTITAEPVEEGKDITINIELKNTADDEFSNIQGNKITITLGDTGLKGELLDANGDALPSTGLNTYEITLVDGKPPQLIFRPDVTNHPHQTGSLDITASVTATEDDASNSVKSEGSGSLIIEESNSGYKAGITAEGSELNDANADHIELSFANDGLVDDGEQIDSAFISDLPDGFTVWVGGDMANNAGSGTWAIPLTGNDLPANISIKPPKNWAGTLDDLKFTVMSGHDGLESSASDINFDLVVNPTPDGVDFTPTLSFGDAGDKISLNLNASMKDPSAATGAAGDEYTEVTELSLTGFPDGEKVLFFIGDSEDPLDESRATFDSTTSTWTIDGLSQSDLQNLKFLHAEGDGNLTVKGRTYEVDSGGNPYQEGGNTKYSDWSADKTAEINVSQTVPTSGDDHFLWDGSAINGFGGNDTVQLRFGDDLKTADFKELENIEIIDMQGSGENTIGTETTGLSIQDVLNMTDSENELTIDGDGEDSVFLSQEWGEDKEAANDSYVAYTNMTSDATINIAKEMSISYDVPIVD
ncbi:immunoglobulin-like domain-containing protein [Marinobacter piscensis]|uniref:immunoglobulin-like domain-containing protein n=1 Tax=Marinobacter piscensis TaxID=1562308 RepID=UPI0011A4CA7B|nr:immunoglobulin-like domain-containing protein [Marinobacter piscensis]